MARPMHLPFGLRAWKPAFPGAVLAAGHFLERGLSVRSKCGARGAAHARAHWSGGLGSPRSRGNPHRQDARGTLQGLVHARCTSTSFPFCFDPAPRPDPFRAVAALRSMSLHSILLSAFSFEFPQFNIQNSPFNIGPRSGPSAPLRLCGSPLRISTAPAPREGCRFRT